ncbi:MAG: DUF4373 domain-containing protein [Cyanobacteria bacterium RUI128]|nr:DUF4373 domain-containing protein [Cyanobacteria bacterium RUI128]
MARPTKLNLDYFPMDVDIFDDIKIRKVMRHHGQKKSFAIYICMLCFIYKNGYFVTVDEDLYFVVSEKVMCPEEDVREVMEYCLSVGLFNQALFEKCNILTSRSIQERYKNVSARRSSEISKEYSLLGNSNTKKSEMAFTEKIQDNASKTEVIATETPVIVTKTPINAVKIPQSKVKESKEKDIDTSLRSVSQSPCPVTDGDKKINFIAFMDFFNRTIQQYQSQIPTITQITPKRRNALNARAKEYGKEALRKAVINAASAPVLNGATNKPFVASFDWIFRPNNFPKVLEGNYNHSVINKNPQSYGTGSNNGYRTSEDLRAGAARIIAEMQAEALRDEG